MSFVMRQLVGFLCLYLIVSSASSDVVGIHQCTELLNTQKLVYCCGKSFLDKFLFVGSNCTPYWDDFGPCRYECLYKHWNLLDQDHKIKKPELYMMITSLYSPLNGYHKYGTALKAAHEICESLGSRHADFLLLYNNQIADHMGVGTSNCLPYAMLHAQCTTIYLTADCPSEYWRPEQECNDLKRVLSSCTKKLDESKEEIQEKHEDMGGNGCGHSLSKGIQMLLASFLALIILSSCMITDSFSKIRDDGGVTIISRVTSNHIGDCI
ncbi:uncharacterized protein LOC128256279 [Drosophila gunungcola]|uniref:uncharacterized protein LOC128256279 n=1 Tax=Drosophila gunungcola TaxID=103775 RepID=UPI0022E7FDDD|nr:uncharacterized protein LOC128256279 [Drosophila gunungcola]